MALIQHQKDEEKKKKEKEAKHKKELLHDIPELNEFDGLIHTKSGKKIDPTDGMVVN